MTEQKRYLEDGHEGKGSVNTVLRQGDEVLRPIGYWSPAVHELLKHLSKEGFTYSPQLYGISQEGYERLSYIDGEVAIRPWPECLLSNNGLEQIGAMLRKYHDIVLNYKPPTNFKWRDPTVKWCDGMIIRHGDLGPWNMVWKSDRLVGLIDWDLALPGRPIDDLAQVAWYCVPLRPNNCSQDTGVNVCHLGERLKCLCSSYGADPNQVLEALITLEQLEMKKIEQLARQGVQPWVDFCKRGDIDDIKHDLQWLLKVTEPAKKGTRMESLFRSTQV